MLHLLYLMFGDRHRVLLLTDYYSRHVSFLNERKISESGGFLSCIALWYLSPKNMEKTLCKLHLREMWLLAYPCYLPNFLHAWTCEAPELKYYRSFSLAWSEGPTSTPKIEAVVFSRRAGTARCCIKSKTLLWGRWVTSVKHHFLTGTLHNCLYLRSVNVTLGCLFFIWNTRVSNP